MWRTLKKVGRGKKVERGLKEGVTISPPEPQVAPIRGSPMGGLRGAGGLRIGVV